ncbi:MAG: DUF1501 domain-containing protein [Alphaproteobacteria bacterium]|jgi:uncharacterized protein (DUF1501 family)|nr:DUF1501 domain-containing protein [Alphaproteobacteria bacterium]
MPTRRDFLELSALLTGSALLPTAAFAAAPGDNRLVVIVLRGGMDGLALVPPHGDPDLRRLRPTLALPMGGTKGVTDLDGFFGLHPGLAALVPLYRAHELAFLHAVAGPYRARSHFDGQDALENGTASALGARDGWLNRALAGMPGRAEDFAMNVGREAMLILRGRQATGSWSPDSRLVLAEDSLQFLERLYANDPLFAEALAGAMAAGQQSAMAGGKRRGRVRAKELAQFTARALSQPSGARIAAFSLGGWDTHRGQKGGLNRPLRELSTAITTLKSGLGAEWRRTVVMGMTEFGRTAAENGTRGTDHGTAGAVLLAGGLVAGGRVVADWPGLGERALHEGRDLKPTDDLRRHAAWVLAGLFGLSRSHLENKVFPGLALGTDPKLLRI